MPSVAEASPTRHYTINANLLTDFEDIPRQAQDDIQYQPIPPNAASLQGQSPHSKAPQMRTHQAKRPQAKPLSPRHNAQKKACPTLVEHALDLLCNRLSYCLLHALRKRY